MGRRTTTIALALLVVGATAVSTHAAADPKAQADDAIQKLDKLKATVLPSKDGDTVSYTVSLYGSNATDADLKLLAALKPLRSVMLGQNNTDAGIDELTMIGDIAVLHLRETKVTVKGIKKLAGWTKLTELGVYGDVSDAWLAEMANIPNLQNLTVFSSDVTKDGLRRLAGCKSLRRFELDGSVDDTALKALSDCKELESLTIHNLFIKGDAAGIGDLAGAPKLTDLSLGSIQFKDGHVKQLAALKQVRRLSVAGVFVSDAAVPDLSQLTWLESLDVFTTAISKEGADKLRKALPKCKIQSK